MYLQGKEKRCLQWEWKRLLQAVKNIGSHIGAQSLSVVHVETMALVLSVLAIEHIKMKKILKKVLTNSRKWVIINISNEREEQKKWVERKRCF
jgi:predicted Ser/Thr protein kinase